MSVSAIRRPFDPSDTRASPEPGGPIVWETPAEPAEGAQAGASAAPGDVPRGVIAIPRNLPPPSRASGDTFLLLQQFECTVLDVADEEFTARMVDRTELTAAPEVADFSVDDVAPGDRDLLAPGAVFYFSLGYRVAPWGQRYREATVRFRRLPAWSRRDLERAKATAAGWAELLGK